MALTSTHKTNITAIETAINTALGTLTNVNDPSQREARATLVKMRRLLELIAVNRKQ